MTTFPRCRHGGDIRWQTPFQSRAPGRLGERHPGLRDQAQDLRRHHEHGRTHGARRPTRPHEDLQQAQGLVLSERKHPIVPRPIQVRHGSMRSQHRSLAARWAVFMPPATLPVVRDEGLAYEADFVEQPARGRIITPTQNPGHNAPCTQVIGPPDPELGRPFFKYTPTL